MAVRQWAYNRYAQSDCPAGWRTRLRSFNSLQPPWRLLFTTPESVPLRDRAWEQYRLVPSGAAAKLKLNLRPVAAANAPKQVWQIHVGARELSHGDQDWSDQVLLQRADHAGTDDQFPNCIKLQQVWCWNEHQNFYQQTLREGPDEKPCHESH